MRTAAGTWIRWCVGSIYVAGQRLFTYNDSAGEVYSTLLTLLRQRSGVEIERREFAGYMTISLRAD